MPYGVEAEGLRRSFGDVVALDGLDLRIPEGVVWGLLGPNGAGKTTAVRVLTTLLRADGGRARVAGLDVARQAAEVRRHIGLVGQQTAVDEILGARENLVLFGRLAHLGEAGARARADELLARFALEDAADRPVSSFSGGMRRRLDLAASLVVDPAVLFLDEPTTGLDPRGRAEVWQAVRALAGTGTTVVLTTQYLEEADELAAGISVIDGGRVVAEGSPSELKALAGEDRLEVVLADAGRLDAATGAVARAVGAAADADPETARISVPVADRVAALAAVLRALDQEGVAALDVGVRRPTLDEVFLQLTGAREEVTA